MSKQYVGIDVGSSSIKGAVIDVDRLQVSTPISREAPGAIDGLPPRHFEQDANALLEATNSVLDELLLTAPDCQGILLCSQMQGAVLCDASGNPLSNYISWRDQRILDPHPSEDGTYFDVLNRRLDENDKLRLGGELKPAAAPSLLFWLSEQDDLPQKSCTPVIIADYIMHQIAGAELVTEYTNALGALNLESRQWHDGVFSKLGLDDIRWPRLADFFEAVGEYEFNGQRIPCYPSVGDHQCALVGTLIRENELSLNVSTGSQVSLLSNELRSGPHQIRPFFDERYLNTITHLPAGRSLNVLVVFITEFSRAQGVSTDPWEYISNAVDNANPSGITSDLAFFAGPMGETGSINGITVDNLTIGNVFRAAFDNMADNYATCATRLSSNRSWSSIVMSGGLPQRFSVLRDAIEQRFGSACRLSYGSEETLQGLMVLALVVDGQATSVSEAIEHVASRQ